MARRGSAIVLVVAVAVVLGGIYQLGQSREQVEAYRQRLETVGQAYKALAATYNEVVKKTAVTELLVEDGTLYVVVRNAKGLIQKIQAPYDPDGEIYVDYIVAEGRLWIRRIYDHKTAPMQGLLIDPELAQITWDKDGGAVGKAVYRRLAEGRWVVTVTGDGSLGLVKVDRPVELAPPPSIKSYEDIQSDLIR